MKRVGRQDRLLLVVFGIAVIVMFARPIQYLLDLAQKVEQALGVHLLMPLTILTLAFFFHLRGKLREAEATIAEAAASQAQARTLEMERLVVFGQALGRSLDIDAIRDVVLHQLPKLAGVEAWALIREEGRWQPLTAGAAELWPPREHLAEQALAGGGPMTPDLMIVEGHVCVPLTAGGNAVGLLGVPEAVTPVPEGRQRILAATAALLGISIRNAQLFRAVRETGLRDGLTGCFNRTHAIEVIDTEMRRSRRSQAPLALIMFDLDHFKTVNDRYGHLCGDAVLTAVGVRMREVLRSSDLKCRYGGEEFLVLLPETPVEGAKRVAETLRSGLADMQLQWKGDVVNVTASFGVTMALPLELDTEAFIGRADGALYQAKDQGRNCVRLSMEPAIA